MIENHHGEIQAPKRSRASLALWILSITYHNVTPTREEINRVEAEICRIEQEEWAAKFSVNRIGNHLPAERK